MRTPCVMGLLGFWGMLLPVACLGAETVNGKIVAGIVEPVAIGASGTVVDAKLDTGADTCSLHATHIHTFDRDGARWVRFDVAGSADWSATIESPVVRTVRIKGDSRGARRPVIRLSVCLGAVQREVEVNLADRNDYAYPVLIGRNFLAGYVIVDPALERTTRPACAPAPSR